MDNPLVSIIIPVYNGEDYISYAIESCLKQTYKNIEVIVINDGSVDNTKNIIDDYVSKNNNIKLISIENAGVSNARNLGIRSSLGEYLMFLDADDRLCSWAVEDLLNMILDYNADISVGQSSVVTSLSADISKNEASEIIVWKEIEPLKHSVEDHPYTYSACAKLYRKQKIENIFFDIRYRINEDSLFFFMCCTRQPEVVITTETVYLCYQSLNSASRSEFSSKKLDIGLVLEEKKGILKQLYPEWDDKIYNLEIKSKMTLLVQLLSSRGYRHVEKECIKYIIKHKNHFLPATEFDKKWFSIIIHHLYYPFKLYKRVKR